MIHTVTLNPAIDRTVTIKQFTIDAVNRVSESRRDPGGKGINVSKVIKNLGGVSCAYGFAAGHAGSFILESLKALGIDHHFVQIAGETRTNLKVVDPELGTHTDINESGPPVSPDAVAKLEEILFSSLQRDDLLLLSGSVPSGIDTGIYGRWIKRAKQMGVRTLLDADGELLRQSIGEGPALVKPNIHELERLTGKTFKNDSATLAAARKLVLGGIGTVVVSLGTQGALFVNADSAILAKGLKVEAKSTVGAGDSMLAAIAMVLQRSTKLEDLVIPAVATATAAVVTEGSAACDPEHVAGFTPLVRYTRL